MFKKLLITFFLTCLACTKVKDPYILSHLSNVQLLEKQDHQFCVSLKLNFDKKDNLSSELYWRCRLSFAKYRLSTDKNMTPRQAKQNSDIGDLITKISLKLSDSSEAILIRENKKMDNLDHQQCLRMGYEIESEDQAKIDDYFACRKALIEERKLLPPFGNTDYLKYQNHSYNLGFVVDQRISEMLKRYNEAKEKYPTCIKYNLRGANFKNCTIAQDNSRQCFNEIDRKKFKKDGEEKILCQKQAYLQFSDDMLKEEDRSQKDINRMNINSDFYNQQSFAGIGIDGAIFSSEQKNQRTS